MLKLWGRKNSINVQKVVWTCEELAIPYDRIDAGMAFGVNKTPEYLALNPNGLVPMIDDGGFVLWESHAIVRYLARRHGLGKLMPADDKTAADADRWMEWYSTTIWPAMQPIFWNLVRVAPDKRDMAAVEAGRKKMIDIMAIADARLAKQPYLAGAAFSMGDMPLALVAYRWYNVPIERPSYPNLDAWFRRITERPAFKTHCMLPLT